jgi:hypothetical protein
MAIFASEHRDEALKILSRVPLVGRYALDRI